MTLRSSSLFCLLLAGLATAPAGAGERLPPLCCPKYPGGVCDCKSFGYFPTCWRFWPACGPSCPPPIPQALISIPGPPSNALPPPTQLPSGPNPPAQMPPAQVPPASSVYARPSLPDQPATAAPSATPAETPADPSK